MISIDDILDELDYYDEFIECIGDPLEYEPEQCNDVITHIEKHFGKIARILSDEDEYAIKIGICVINPTPERDYYTLVTAGFGAMLMNVPSQFAYGDYSRAELMICLPKWWKFDTTQKKWNWPIYFMRAFARIPLMENSWFAAEHIIPVHMPIAENTKLCGFILLEPQQYPKQAGTCMLDDKSRVNFYQLIPLYAEEMDFELEHGTEELLKRMADVNHVVDMKRLNSCSALSPLM